MNNSVLYMQQQAEQRVRRMQEQARRMVEREEQLPRQRELVSKDKCENRSGGGSEQWMLLLLALLLHQNGARPELLLALLYLAL